MEGEEGREGEGEREVNTHTHTHRSQLANSLSSHTELRNSLQACLCFMRDCSKIP